MFSSPRSRRRHCLEYLGHRRTADPGPAFGIDETDRVRESSWAGTRRAATSALSPLAGVGFIVSGESGACSDRAGADRDDPRLECRSNFRTDPGYPNAISQLFTTGSQVDGYTFTTVDVYLGTQNFDGGCTATGSVAVSICSNNQSNQPDSSVYSLTAPSALTSGGFNTFTAPPNASLSADTDYHVHVTVTSETPTSMSTSWSLISVGWSDT